MPPYGAGLKVQVRRKEPDQFLENLLVTGLIEARSNDSLGLLATDYPEAELAKFYRGLMALEARHFGTYWILADT
jgi:tRNA-(ms[2]io[6]A)-hydroxylase